jgi:hypothetical protein
MVRKAFRRYAASPIGVVLLTLTAFTTPAARLGGSGSSCSFGTRDQGVASATRAAPNDAGSPTVASDRHAARAALPAGAKSVEIGFGIGPLRGARRVTPALVRIHNDGFRVIRGYEPFQMGDPPGYGRVIGPLRTLDSMGFTPFVGLSNFPAQLMPANAQLPVGGSGRNQRKARKLQNISEHTNRFAPDPQAFDGMLTGLLNSLVQTFGRDKLQSWHFEIGNEPDADKFFWGTPEQFDALMRVAISRFHAVDPQIAVGGGAFTTALIRGASKHEAYASLARSLSQSSSDFVSVHVYSRSFPDPAQIGQELNGLLGSQKTAERVISEWNVRTRGDGDMQQILNSTAIMPALIDVLGAAYESDVSLILIHKLMDDASDGGGQLGLFNPDGSPKGGYASVVTAAQFARSGFTLSRPNGATQLAGSSMVLIHAADRDVPFDGSAYRVAMSSQVVGNSVRAGGWAVLQRR